MITQSGDFLKRITVVNVNLMNVMFLPWIRSGKHVATVGKLKLNDPAEHNLAVVADSGLKKVIES